MKCDIVIPTYNNAVQITETLESVFQQAVPGGWSFQIIISDDGSTDETLSLLKKQIVPVSWSLATLTGPHTGPGGARARAVSHLTGDITFLLGADILLRPDALAKHLAFHEQHSDATLAALGMVRWDPRLSPTPFMEWMTHGGQQNDFDSLLGRLTADPAHFFYGSHLSLKTALLRQTRFISSLQEYGWEDLSLGRELKKQGLRLQVLHTAVALHRHFYAITAIQKRQQAIGYSFKTYQELYPDVTRPLIRSRVSHMGRFGWCQLGGQALLLEWLRLWERFSFPRLFLVFTSLEFWRGVWRSYGSFLAFLRENSMFYSKLK